MRCLIDGVSHKGEGVARIDGQVAFVPFAIPGETVEAEVKEYKKGYLRARLQEVIQASPDRVKPPCPYYYTCGGCSYQHIDYSRQLELKRQVVIDNLKRIGGLEAEVSPVIGMNDPWRYRNKVEWHVSRECGQYKMGYHLPDSNQVLSINTCLLISPAMEKLSQYVQEHLSEMRIPDKCQITVRQSATSGEMMLIFRGTGAESTKTDLLCNLPNLTSIGSISQGRVVSQFGQFVLEERLADVSFEMSPLAFFQVNHQQAEVLVDTIKEYARIQPGDTVLDGYCGIGSIALALADQAKRAVGVESFKGAVADARKNAQKNHITNCEFVSGACEKVIPVLREKFDVVILDPPRAGCKKEVIEAVIKAAPKRIIYVSCHPGTMARDLKTFCQDGYKVNKVQPIDMFPQTSHVETVVLMSRVTA